jgi:hippurate hydrolase
MDLLEPILANAAAITEMRRDLHAHPELAYQEERTASRIAAQLTQWGVQVHQGLGKTGLVGVIQGRDGGKSARSVGLRADMDALPIQELNTIDYKSVYPGRMHACGHDGHMAMLLAAGQYLAANRNFDGTVYLVFQPAEEGGAGASAMIADGLFERFPMEAIFGLHNWPGLAQGVLAVSPGPVMASSNDFHITLVGKGGHAAMPHLCCDPVALACLLVQAFQNIITRNRNPFNAGVLSVTMIHAGDADNVIPDTCELQGTVRTFDTPTLDLIEQRMRDLTQGLCVAHGATHKFVFERKYPPTINSAYEARFASDVASAVTGSTTPPQTPSMGAEDFAFMLAKKPGAYAFIGNGERDENNVGQCALHNARYNFNDAIIPLGATYWVRLAQRWLSHKPPQIA